jgi:5-methyltetrahydrofolate--homocysteine methyltransferase
VVDEQINDLGLEVIDVCMDSNLVDTTTTLCRSSIARPPTSRARCRIDSFAVDALEAAAKVYPGRPIINSMSMEDVADGVTKVDAVIAATKFHDPVYIALCAGRRARRDTGTQGAHLAGVVDNAAKHGVGRSAFSST